MVGLERGWRVWRRKTPELRRLGMNSRNSSTPPAGLDRDESGAAGGPLFGGTLEGAASRWSAGAQGYGAGTGGDAGSDRDPGAAG